MDQIDRELTAALSVEPSPQFRARVRARIETEVVSSTWRLSWRVAVSGAIVAAVVVVVTWSRPRGVDRPMGIDVQAPSAEAARIAPLADVVTTRASAVAHVRKRRVSVEPEVLIDAQEARAIRALINRAGEEQIELTPLVVARPAGTEAHAVSAIYIGPIEFQPLNISLNDISDKGAPQ